MTTQTTTNNNGTHTSSDEDGRKVTSELALTREDIAMLRKADSVCFDHNEARTDYHIGKQIRAIKRGKKGQEDYTYRVRCISTVHIHSDTLDYDTRNGKGVSCFNMIHCSQYSEEWRTIVSLLKPGDEIELRWVGADHNGYINAARLTECGKGDNSPSIHNQGEPIYHDKLYLHIRRGGKRKYSFYLMDSICPHNSARMIRYGSLR